MKTTLFAMIVVLFLIMCPWGDHAWTQDKTAPWMEMINKEKAMLHNTRMELERYISEQPARIQDVRDKTGELQQQLRKLSIAYNIEDGNSIELRDKLSQIDRIRAEGQGVVSHLISELESLDIFGKSLQGNLREYEQLARESFLKEKQEILTEYILELKHILNLVDTAKQLTAIAPNSVDELFIRLHSKRVEIEKDLLKSWKTNYFHPVPVYYFSAKGWKEAQRGLDQWIRFMPYWHIPLKENWGSFRNDLFLALIAVVILVFLSTYLLGKLERRSNLAGLRGNFFPSSLWFGFGIPIYVMIALCGQGGFGILRFAAETIIAGGIVTLSWRMRMFLPHRGGLSKRNIHWPLWALFTVLIGVMTSHFPLYLATPFLALLLIVCSLYLLSIRKGFIGQFDKRIGKIMPWLLFFLMILTLSKWGGIAIFLTIISFIVFLNMEFCYNVVCIMEYLSRANKERPVAHNIMNGILLPLLLIGFITVSLIWLCLFSGGMPLLKGIVEWRVNFGLFYLNLSMVIIILAIFFVVRFITMFLNRVLDAIGTRREEIRMGTIRSIQAITAYAVWCLYALFSLNLLGVKLEHIALIAGGLSIGVGLGLQDIVKNFFSGLILLFGRSIHPGDEIQIEDIRGTVIKINIRNAIIQTNEDSTIFIPNSDLAYKKIVNWTYKDPKGRAEIVVGVAYDSDTDQVRDLLIQSAHAHPQVLREPQPYVLFSDFGESTLIFRLRFWIKNLVHKRDRVSSAIRFEIDRVFRENGIEISYPQREIHIRQEGFRWRRFISGWRSFPTNRGGTRCD